jgi:hypothetical protein
MTTPETIRLASLERSLRRTHVFLTLAIGCLVVLGVTALSRSPQAPQVLRARGIIIEDEKGRDRILIGAPVPNPREGTRISPTTGLVINDSAGYERFGVGLKANGSIGMGFDAPPGTGDDRNRERINIIADERGAAQIRLLDQDTWVRARLILDDQKRVGFEFLKFPVGEVVARRLTADGDSTWRQARR